MRLSTVNKAFIAAASALKGQVREVEDDGPLSEFARLYHQYFRRVFAFVYARTGDKDLALDIVSDVFEKTFLKKPSFRPQESFAARLFAIARREVASHRRLEKSIGGIIQDPAWASLTTLARLQLSEREQEVISLKFDAELTNHEIAQVLRTSEENIQATIFQALRKLRDRLQQGVY